MLLNRSIRTRSIPPDSSQVLVSLASGDGALSPAIKEYCFVSGGVRVEAFCW